MINIKLLPFDHSALARADCIKRAEHKRPVFAPGIMTSSWSVARCFEQVEPDPLSLWANLCRRDKRNSGEISRYIGRERLQRLVRRWWKGGRTTRCRLTLLQTRITLPSLVQGNLIQQVVAFQTTCHLEALSMYFHSLIPCYKPSSIKLASKKRIFELTSVSSIFYDPSSDKRYEKRTNVFAVNSVSS